MGRLTITISDPDRTSAELFRVFFPDGVFESTSRLTDILGEGHYTINYEVGGGSPGGEKYLHFDP
jgi:hypothetical protein